MKKVNIFLLLVVSLYSCKSVFEGSTLVYSKNEIDWCHYQGGSRLSNNKNPELFHYKYENQYFDFIKYGDSCYRRAMDFKFIEVGKDSVWYYDNYYPVGESYDTNSVYWVKIKDEYYLKRKFTKYPNSKSRLLNPKGHKDSFSYYPGTLPRSGNRAAQVYFSDTPIDTIIMFNKKKVKCYKVLVLRTDRRDIVYDGLKRDYWWDLYLEKKSLAPIYCVRHLDDGGRKVTFYLSRYYKMDENGKLIYESEKVEEPDYYFLGKRLPEPMKEIKDTSDSEVIIEYK